MTMLLGTVSFGVRGIQAMTAFLGRQTGVFYWGTLGLVAQGTWIGLLFGTGIIGVKSLLALSTLATLALVIATINAAR